MRYEFVFLDADDTLYDFPAAEKSAFCGALKHFKLSADSDIYATYHHINEQLWKKLERGEITQEALRLQRFEELFATCGIKLDAKDFAPVYLTHLALGAQLLPGAAELVLALYGKVRLCIATNGISEVQRGRIAKSGIAHCFEALLISGELGAQKPSALFFKRAFELLGGVDPAKVILLGDSLTSDMRGGKNAGITTCWFNPAKKPCAQPELCDYQIHSLSDFPRIIGLDM